MRFTIPAIFAIVVALSEFAAAAPQVAGGGREGLKAQCKSQACIDAVDSGCPLNSINFKFGCDENGAGQ